MSSSIEKNDIANNQWSREENWILLRSTRYVKKCEKNKQKTWSDLFYERCPYKKHFKACKRHTQAYNIEKAQIFTDQELYRMEKKVEEAIKLRNI